MVNLKPLKYKTMKIVLKQIQYVGYFIIGIAILHSCTYTQKIKDGKMAFEQKQYALATKMLRTEFNKSKSSAEKGVKSISNRGILSNFETNQKNP